VVELPSKKYTSAEIEQFRQDVSNQLGCIEVKLVSDLTLPEDGAATVKVKEAPVTIYEYAPSRHTRFVYGFNSRSWHSAKATPINELVKGYYVFVKNKSLVPVSAHKESQSLLEIGLMLKYNHVLPKPVYAVRTKELPDFKNDPSWVSLEDAALEKLTELMSCKIHQSQWVYNKLDNMFGYMGKRNLDLFLRDTELKNCHW
jgi:hypothetical protein